MLFSAHGITIITQVITQLMKKINIFLCSYLVFKIEIKFSIGTEMLST